MTVMMTQTKNRLTNQQREMLAHWLRVNDNGADVYRLAHDATDDLGFFINSNNIHGARRMQLEPVRMDLEFDYTEKNATTQHRDFLPHQISEEGRSVETLERLRRMETMLCLICDKLGVARR